MGTSTGSATNNMPRITDKWGKYAKKDSGTNTTTTVSSNGTTVTTNAKNVKVNIFNGQPPQKPGNVVYNSRTFNIPKNIWGSPYPFAGMGGMNFDAASMPSIWGNMGGCSGSGRKLDNWDRFYQFANGPISGQVFGAAALGGLGGLAMGIGKALSGDDKKADKSDDSSKIKDYYNGTSSTSGTSSSSSTSSTSSPGSSASSSPKQTEKFEKINDSEFQSLQSVQKYNNSLSELSTKQTAVTTARTAAAQKQTVANEAARALREHEVKVTNLKTAYGEAQAAFDKVKDADPKPENYDALQKAADDAKEAYEKAKSDTTAKDAKESADTELESANKAVKAAEDALSAETTKVKDLKTEAERQIKYIKTGDDGRSVYETIAPNFMGGRSSYSI